MTSTIFTDLRMKDRPLRTKQSIKGWPASGRFRRLPTFESEYRSTVISLEQTLQQRHTEVHRHLKFDQPVFSVRSWPMPA